MQKSEKFVVLDDTLQTEPTPIQVGSTAWFVWLSQHEKFSFQGRSDRFMAQREIRRNSAYWYAYRRRAGKLFKLYLGKSDELTLERLRQVGFSLAGEREALPEPPPAPQADSALRMDASFMPRSRVNIPVLPPQIISRPRLISQINTPLTLIYAPSGFGKSTLLNDWRQTCGQPVAWLLLDDADNHTFRFWAAVITALQTILPDFGAALLADLRGASQLQLADAVSRLTDEILGTACPHFCLALDDFHHINNPEIYDSLQGWVRHLPVNMQLVILGHTRPPLALGDLRARGILTELDANDLRFTLNEGIRYLEQYQQQTPIAYTDLEKLVRHTEGWAAGLTLSALALGKQEDRRQFIDTFSGAHIYLREYFMETVLQHCSPALQSFLLKTAILKHLTGALCDAVTGQTGGADMLSHLWQENLFIVRLDDEGWYRYHDLFAEMLLGQLQSRFSDEIPQLHQRAARWYREQYAPADAVYHLLSIKAWEEAAALIEEMALRELEQYGEDSRLLRWLQELPASVVQKHKTLLFVYLRLADVALPRQKIEDFIRAIENNLSSRPLSMQTPDEREALAEIQRIRTIWKQGGVVTPPVWHNDENNNRWEVFDGLHLLKQFYRPNQPLQEDELIALFRHAQAQRNLFVVLIAGGFLARRVYLNGQLRSAEKIAHQVLEQAQQQRGSLPEPASIVLTILSQIHLERSELPLAQKYLAQAQEVDPNPTSSNMLIQFAIQRSKIQAAQGKNDEALANIRAIRALHSQRPSAVWTDQDLCAYEAFILLRKGDILSAERLMNEWESSDAQDLSQLARAEIFLKKGQADLAEKLLAQFVAQSQNDVLYEPLMGASVLLSLALMAQHKSNQALQTITDAIRLAAPERFFRPFVENSDCIPLLSLALKTEKLTADARRFIAETLRVAGNPQAYPDQMASLSASASISQRERDVLHLLNNAHSNREMAEKLSVSESTIKTHLENIYRKLGVKSRIQAVKRAKELELV